MLGKLYIPYYVTLELDRRLQTEMWWDIATHIKTDMNKKSESTYVKRYNDRIIEWFETTNDSFETMVAYLNPFTCPENITRYWKVTGKNNYI